MAGGPRREYDRRVNRVIDHIRSHLADELSLGTLAELAAFSPFPFHRVFRAVTGETVAGFVQRTRIEKAAAALRDHPARGVLEIALDHGFGSAAAFARASRGRFGMTATAWRTGGAERWRRRWRKADQRLRKLGKAPGGGRRDTARMSIEVVDMPALHVACVFRCALHLPIRRL